MFSSFHDKPLIDWVANVFKLDTDLICKLFNCCIYN